MTFYRGEEVKVKMKVYKEGTQEEVTSGISVSCSFYKPDGTLMQTINLSYNSNENYWIGYFSIPSGADVGTWKAVAKAESGSHISIETLKMPVLPIP